MQEFVLEFKNSHTFSVFRSQLVGIVPVNLINIILLKLFIPSSNSIRFSCMLHASAVFCLWVTTPLAVPLEAFRRGFLSSLTWDCSIITLGYLIVTFAGCLFGCLSYQNSFRIHGHVGNFFKACYCCFALILFEWKTKLVLDFKYCTTLFAYTDMSLTKKNPN